MEKADVLEYYDQTVNSPNGSFYIPAVLRVPHLLQVVKRRRFVSLLSRKNATACLSCNSKKGHKTPEEANMKLHKAPKAPKDYDIVAIPLTNMAIKMLKMRKGTPEEWLQYLGGPSP
uniref:Uncharacterized protein n=1 Tax=Lactuca sativa TaxID=4236 RepID=A0A9R1X4Z4_LACSA|nr:hypothetical protein LSAT_V11C600312840 [Lactuca sativa]